jgi:CPA1 family monovalent cation:H+ antiporter
VIVFLLEGLIFILLGLQLPAIVDEVDALPLSDLALYARAIVVSVVVVRIAWVVPTTVTWLSRRGMQTGKHPYGSEAQRSAVVIGWAGLRGADTLVIALALPQTLAGGSPFPDRSLLLFLTLCVLLATLFGQGLTLPWLIRRLGLAGDSRHEQEVARTRVAAAEAAIERLDELAAGNGQVKALTDGLRGRYEERTHRYDARRRGNRDVAAEALAATRREVIQDILTAQRHALIELRDRGEIGDHALREVLTELDLEALRLTTDLPRAATPAVS